MPSHVEALKFVIELSEEIFSALRTSIKHVSGTDTRLECSVFVATAAILQQ